MMTVEIKIIENPLSDWKLGDPCLICNRMFSYTEAEYVAVVYVDEERDFICGDCLKKGPEAIKKAAQSVLKKSGTKFGLAKRSGVVRKDCFRRYCLPLG